MIYRSPWHSPCRNKVNPRPTRSHPCCLVGTACIIGPCLLYSNKLDWRNQDDQIHLAYSVQPRACRPVYRPLKCVSGVLINDACWISAASGSSGRPGSLFFCFLGWPLVVHVSLSVCSRLMSALARAWIDCTFVPWRRGTFFFPIMKSTVTFYHERLL